MNKIKINMIKVYNYSNMNRNNSFKKKQIIFKNNIKISKIS